MKINKTIVKPAESLQTDDLPKRKQNYFKSDRKGNNAKFFILAIKQKKAIFI